MNLTHDYLSLPPLFYSEVRPQPVSDSELVLLNEPLARELGLEPQQLYTNPDWLTGSRFPEGARPVAQAYSGHQFGYYTRLGDGRAVLLGEIEKDGVLYDLHLKGAGHTPYSRGGDGRAALGHMLREYLISEAMHALSVPTTRSLAVATTGQPVRRERMLPGAVLTRVAKSHLRVGTFQYALEAGGEDAVRTLSDYAVLRHGIDPKNDPLTALFEAVLAGQAELIAAWMSIGFIHGVMNTDNMTISGETIDYGPCAFMDRYHENTVFSSIDRQGRYAYKNQPVIAKWNLARFAEALLGAMEDAEAKLPEMQKALVDFDRRYRRAYYRRFAAKIGLSYAEEKDERLIDWLLVLMQERELDFTNTFAELTRGASDTGIPKDWLERRRQRLQEQGMTEEDAARRMRAANPVLIPRNHRVEAVLARAEAGDLSGFETLLARLRDPYNYDLPVDPADAKPMPEADRAAYCTYCGT